MVDQVYECSSPHVNSTSLTILRFIYMFWPTNHRCVLMSTRLPLYKIVKQKLTDALQDGTWKHGQFLPPEPELAQRFGASVGTLRKAVDELVAENLLVRRQGQGTHVASHTRDTMLTRFFQIVDRDGNK